MKRSLFLIITLYLFSISGIAAQIHYCGGEFETLTFGFEESDKCCCEVKSTCNNCCKNEHFKPSVSKHFSSQPQLVKLQVFVFTPAIQHSQLLIKQPIILSEAYSCLQLKDYNVPDFIRNCVYRL
jgi:hypothetical protein